MYHDTHKYSLRLDHFKSNILACCLGRSVFQCYPNNWWPSDKTLHACTLFRNCKLNSLLYVTMESNSCGIQLLSCFVCKCPKIHSSPVPSLSQPLLAISVLLTCQTSNTLQVNTCTCSHVQPSCLQYTRNETTKSEHMLSV